MVYFLVSTHIPINTFNRKSFNENFQMLIEFKKFCSSKASYPADPNFNNLVSLTPTCMSGMDCAIFLA